MTRSALVTGASSGIGRALARRLGAEAYVVADLATDAGVKAVAKQLLIALDFIHGLKVIHCDIKPENIMIKSYSRAQF